MRRRALPLTSGHAPRLICSCHVARWLRVVPVVAGPTSRRTDLAGRDHGRFVRGPGAGRETSAAAGFEHVYRAHCGALRRYVAYALANSSEADDVVQAVMTNAFAACSRSHRPVVSMRAWLFTIARHELLKYFDRRRLLTLLEQGEIERR